MFWVFSGDRTFTIMATSIWDGYVSIWDLCLCTLYSKHYRAIFFWSIYLSCEASFPFRAGNLCTSYQTKTISFWKDSSSEEDDSSSSSSSSSKPVAAQQLRERKRKALAKRKAAAEKRRAERPLPPGLQTGWKFSSINTKGLNKLTRNRRNRKRNLTLNIAAYGPGARRQTQVGWPAVYSSLEGLDLKIVMGASLAYDRREKRQWTFHVFCVSGIISHSIPDTIQDPNIKIVSLHQSTFCKTPPSIA